MITELIPNLVICNWREAQNTVGYYTITVAGDSPYRGDEVFPLVDGPGNTQELFDNAVAAVYAAYRANKRVIVHCVGGRSRSAAVIVAATSLLTERSICSIYDELLAKHDKTGEGARIHPHLASLLLKYER